MRLRDGRRARDDSDGWLVVGTAYAVLAVETNLLATDTSMRALFRLQTNTDSTPGLWSAVLFEVEDGALPGPWEIAVVSNGDIELSPPAWREVGFWERYADRDAEAIDTFERVMEQFETP